MPGDIIIRPFTPADIPAMTRIYAHYVKTSTVTFDEEEPTNQTMSEKFEAMTALGHPLIIAEQDGMVRGYAYASTYRPRPAYRFTCEDTLYLDPETRGAGIGSKLMADLIKRAQAFGFKQMIGVIEATAEPSIGLHKKFGFEIVGRNTDVGYKFECWHSTLHMQRAL